jgi:hypothetical protein
MRGRPRKHPLMAPRDDMGRFQKGYSGNPKGASKAELPLTHLRRLRRQFTNMSIERVDTVTPALINKVIEMALAGHEGMIKLLWSHMVDKGYLNSITEQLKSKTADDIDMSQEIILDKMVTGEIDIEHGMLLQKAFAIKRDSSLVKVLEAEVNEITRGK